MTLQAANSNGSSNEPVRCADARGTRASPCHPSASPSANSMYGPLTSSSVAPPHNAASCFPASATCEGSPFCFTLTRVCAGSSSARDLRARRFLMGRCRRVVHERRRRAGTPPHRACEPCGPPFPSLMRARETPDHSVSSSACDHAPCCCGLLVLGLAPACARARGHAPSRQRMPAPSARGRHGCGMASPPRPGPHGPPPRSCCWALPLVLLPLAQQQQGAGWLWKPLLKPA